MVARVPAVPPKQRGGARPGAGRPKGIPNKPRTYTSLRGEVVTMRYRYEVMPLDHLMKIINTVCVQRRGESAEDYAARVKEHHYRQDAAAKAAAPYMHYRLASVELSNRDGEPTRHQIDLTRLSDEELATLQKLTRKAEVTSTVDLGQTDYTRLVEEDEEEEQATMQDDNNE